MDSDLKVYRQICRFCTFVVWALPLLLLAGLPADVAELMSKPLWMRILAIATAALFTGALTAFAAVWTWFFLPLVQRLAE